MWLSRSRLECYDTILCPPPRFITTSLQLFAVLLTQLLSHILAALAYNEVLGATFTIWLSSTSTNYLLHIRCLSSWCWRGAVR